MKVNIDSDLVRTKFDSRKQLCTYTAKIGERHWTICIPLSELHAHSGNKMARRKIVERYFQTALNGPADGEAAG